MSGSKPNTKRAVEAADMKADLPIETRLQAARTALHLALLAGEPGTATLRQTVRTLEAEAQAAADAQTAHEAAARAADQSKAAEREAEIRAASQTLLESRNARLDIVRNHFTVRTVPDLRSSFAS